MFSAILFGDSFSESFLVSIVFQHHDLTLRERQRISIFHSSLYSFSRHFLRITYYNWILQFISVFIHNLLRFRYKRNGIELQYSLILKMLAPPIQCKPFEDHEQMNGNSLFFSDFIRICWMQHIQLKFSISIHLCISKSIHIK